MIESLQSKKAVLLEQLKLLEEEALKSNINKELFNQIEKCILDLSENALQIADTLTRERNVAGHLKDSLSQLLLLQNLSELINRTKNIDDVLAALFNIVQRVVRFNSGGVYLFDRRTKSYSLRFSKQLDVRQKAIIQSHLDEGVISWVMSKKRAVEVPTLQNLDEHSREEAKGFIIVPLLAGDQKIGFFEILKVDLQEIHTSAHFDMLEFLARQTAIAIENNLLYEQLHQADELFRKSQLQIIHAEKMAAMGVLASGVAHEINNPLQIILSRVQLLLKKIQDQEVRAPLKLVEVGTLRISDIVGSMLRYTKQQNQPNFQLVKVEPLIQDVLMMVQPQLALQKVEVICEFDPNVGKLFLNPGEVKQVFLNLFENARHAMQDGGKLFVRTYARRGEVCIEVEDTGYGISKENLSKIFVPFFTTKPPNEGTGLGLYLCYGIIEHHRGRIHVESTVGMGTKFTIRFPMNEVWTEEA